MKMLCEMTKAELVEKVLRIDPRETRKHVERQSKAILISWIERYRRYNPIIAE